MIILGIETSCDDTSAAVVENGDTVLASVVSSQEKIHGRYQGVVPELASREHIRNIVPVTAAALEKAGLSLAGIAAIAVTVGPGLIGSLFVGLSYAKALGYAADIPLYGINHLEGHIASAWLSRTWGTHLSHGRPRVRKC